MARKSKRARGATGPNPKPERRGPGRLGLIVLLLALIAGGTIFACTRRVPAPPSVAASGLDPAVAGLIENCVREVKASPRSGAAWGKLGAALMHAQFGAEAGFAFAQAERLSPRDARWPYLQGVLLKENAAEAALARWEVATRLCGDQPDAPRLRLAQLLLERGRLDLAEAQFERLLSLQPAHPPALLGLARIRLAQGRPAEALDLLTRCANDPHVAKSAHALLAQVHRQLGDPAAAESAARALSGLPPDPSWPDPFWSETLQYRVGKRARIEQAQALIDAGRLADAFKVLNRVANDYPTDDESRYLIGWILNREGRGREAEDSLREHLRLSPHSPKGHAQLAVALLAQERYADALEVLQRAIQLKPTWAELHFNLGYACAHLGRNEEAVTHFREALRHDPNYVDGYIALADLLSQRGEQDEAARLLRQVLALNPSDERARFLQQRIGGKH